MAAQEVSRMLFSRYQAVDRLGDFSSPENEYGCWLKLNMSV
nr:hypothetical protein [Paenibacillus larvae]